MEGDPGSMSAYSRALRDMFKGKPGPCPADYYVSDAILGAIRRRCETIPPFDVTALRQLPLNLVGPGPIYMPIVRDRREYGSPLFRWGERFKEKIDFDCSTPFWGRIPDPWMQMRNRIFAMGAMRPRISYEQFVSNCVPTVFHPLDIRCFVPGMDGRVYPWRLNRRNKMPSPSDYDTYQIYTSRSHLPAVINFGKMAKRRELFPPGIGVGPAGYYVRRPSRAEGGTMLGKSATIKDSSSLRLFDIVQRQTIRDNFGGPASEMINVPRGFEKCSPKAVLAPFKSKSPLGFVKPAAGPGPAAYFLQEPRSPYPCTGTCPPEPAPFDTTEERFLHPEEYELMDRPSPAEYDIPGFTDLMLLDLKRHPAAIKNPKLGFLSSAEARPTKKDKGDINIISRRSCHCLCDPPRSWRNLRPKKGKTYRYNGPPRKYPDSPGPIYDTAPGMAAVKARKSWLDARRSNTSGFLNSGCARKTDFYYIDKNVPGPGKYYSKLPCCDDVHYQGRRPTPGPRFPSSTSFGPGPAHKLHEKTESVWRASHLGTFNAFLKQVGVLFPWAGGFHKKNLDQAGDKAWHIERKDEYKELGLCPKTLEQAKHLVKLENKLCN